jgi:hypothetical protein
MGMKRCIMAILSIAAWALGAESGEPQAKRLLWLVMGAPGEERFARDFAAQADLWKKEAARAGDVDLREILGREALQAACSSDEGRRSPELWIVLIGHGTFDGRVAKFNLEGPDVAAQELAVWLSARTQPLVLIHTGECSGPFLPALSAKNRVIVTATQSGSEVVATRFGGHFAAAMGEPLSDLNRDGAVSVLEAFLVGAQRTAEFYEQDRRLLSEHALIDDTGDGKGTRADWFEGGRATRKSLDGAAADGVRAGRISLVPGPADQGLSGEERLRRDQLEEEIESLRNRRGKMGEKEWYELLEAKFLELGSLLGG